MSSSIQKKSLIILSVIVLFFVLPAYGFEEFPEMPDDAQEMMYNTTDGSKAGSTGCHFYTVDDTLYVHFIPDQNKYTPRLVISQDDMRYPVVYVDQLGRTYDSINSYLPVTYKILPFSEEDEKLFFDINMYFSPVDKTFDPNRSLYITWNSSLRDGVFLYKKENISYGIDFDFDNAVKASCYDRTYSHSNIMFTAYINDNKGVIMIHFITERIVRYDIDMSIYYKNMKLNYSVVNPSDPNHDSSRLLIFAPKTYQIKLECFEGFDPYSPLTLIFPGDKISEHETIEYYLNDPEHFDICADVNISEITTVDANDIDTPDINDDIIDSKEKTYDDGYLEGIEFCKANPGQCGIDIKDTYTEGFNAGASSIDQAAIYNDAYADGNDHGYAQGVNDAKAEAVCAPGVQPDGSWLIPFPDPATVTESNFWNAVAPGVEMFDSWQSERKQK